LPVLDHLGIERRIEGAGHWMQLDEPAALSTLLIDFLPTP